MKKLHLYTLNIFIIIALSLGNAYAQNGDPNGSGPGDPNGNNPGDPVGGSEYEDPTLDPNYAFPPGPVNISDCFTVGVDQHYVLHLENESVLVLELLETPASEVRVYDSNDAIVGSTFNKKSFFSLSPNAQYEVRTTNTCNQEGLVINISTEPRSSKSNVEFPIKIFEALAENSNSEDELSVLDYLQTNETLTATDKLYAIQEYYFDGNFTPGLNSGILCWLGDTSVLDAQSGWDYLGDRIKVHTFLVLNRDCNCKVVYTSDNGHTEIEKIHNGAPFKWYQHKVEAATPFTGSKDSYFEYRNATKGAMKSYQAKQWMKGQGTTPHPKEFPDFNGGKSPYKTYIAYNLICEDSLGQSSGCLCVNRSVNVQASYITELKTDGGKLDKCFLCGNGYRYHAQVEDWVVLTKSSKMTGIGILDAGRASSYKYGGSALNADWLREVLDVATAVTMAVASKGATVNATTISNVTNSLVTIFTTSSRLGFNSAKSIGPTELLGGPGTPGQTVSLLPNDPTYITMHGFYASHLEGHTKWWSEASIESRNYLVGYITDQLTPTCCNEETYNWIIGVNYLTQHAEALKGVNDFLQISGVSTQRFPTMIDKEYTGNDESGFQVIPSCVQHGYGPTLVDTDILPQGTQYLVANLLFGFTVKSGVTAGNMTLANLKAMILNDPNIPSSSYYGLLIIVNGQTFNLSIYKP